MFNVAMLYLLAGDVVEAHVNLRLSHRLLFTSLKGMT